MLWIWPSLFKCLFSRFLSALHKFLCFLFNENSNLGSILNEIIQIEPCQDGFTDRARVHWKFSRSHISGGRATSEQTSVLRIFESARIAAVRSNSNNRTETRPKAANGMAGMSWHAYARPLKDEVGINGAWLRWARRKYLYVCVYVCM